MSWIKSLSYPVTQHQQYYILFHKAEVIGAAIISFRIYECTQFYSMEVFFFKARLTIINYSCKDKLTKQDKETCTK